MDNKSNSHKQILKSTSIVGGTQIFLIVIGIFRTKVIAVLLGPAGIGYVGVLQNIIELVKQATGFGISFSGVKDIAESNASNDPMQISRTITVLRRWATGTGILGMLVTIALCIPLSKYSFGNDTHAISIAIISVTILIASISGGQIALLQGLRKIEQMAKASIYGTLFGTLITLPLYWWLGRGGIVPGMILSALGGVVISWWFSNKVKIDKVNISFKETYKKGLGMARLGFYITITAIMAAIALYLVRSFLLKKMNLDAVGYFQACWMIANMYLGILLNGMLADFFPRLTAISADNVSSNKLINEQLEIALIVGSPMIMGIVAFASFIIQLLYSSSFKMAIPVLQWQIAGTFLTLISWTLGVMFLAKSKGAFSLLSEGLWSLVFFGFVYFGWNYFGFISLGIGYVFASVIRTLVVYACTWYLGRFSFNNTNCKYILMYGVLIISMLCVVRLFNGYLQYSISAMLLLLSIIISYVNLKKIIDLSSITTYVKGKF